MAIRREQASQSSSTVEHCFRKAGVAGSIPAVANFVVFTNDYLGQVDVPLLTFPETSIATEARASA